MLANLPAARGVLASDKLWHALPLRPTRHTGAYSWPSKTAGTHEGRICLLCELTDSHCSLPACSRLGVHIPPAFAYKASMSLWQLGTAKQPQVCHRQPQLLRACRL